MNFQRNKWPKNLREYVKIIVSIIPVLFFYFTCIYAIKFSSDTEQFINAVMGFSIIFVVSSIGKNSKLFEILKFTNY